MSNQHARDLADVQKNGYRLEFVKDQTEEICLAAINQNYRSIKFVKRQTEAICIEAVKQKYIQDPYEDEYQLVFVLVDDDDDYSINL